MKIAAPYRDVAYSLSDRGNGKWGWKLHPKKQANVMSAIISGEVVGTREDAIAAAEAAIDKGLGPKPN